MKPFSPDTSPAVQRIQCELMRRVPGWKRLQFALELTQATRQLVAADIRHHFPAAGEDEIRRRFISRVLPREDVIRAYGFDPTQEGY
jgi:hypothetical protein